MKRRLLLVAALVALTIPFQAHAQIPRTVLVEMLSATW